MTKKVNMPTHGKTVSGNKKAYDRFLTTERYRKSRIYGRTLEEEADSDRGRVLFSAPFRRLQNRAQVFALESNDAIHSRLTHSIEVSSIGRYVAQQAFKGFSGEESERLGLAGKERPFITFVETACLIHDLGNPPYGHFGEVAISDWFHTKESDLRPHDIAGAAKAHWDELFEDFVHFDGNPQGFRIVSKLQPRKTDDLFGMNLTATTLGAILKYPWSSSCVAGDKKKAGYFCTEGDVVCWLREVMGMNDKCRHPLVYLMEAADDIAYCISDIEDGIEKGIVVPQDFARSMTQKISRIRKHKVPSNAEPDMQSMNRALADLSHPRKDSLICMEDLRGSVVRLLARSAGLAFVRHQKDVLDGSAVPLLHHGQAEGLLRALNDFAEENLYSSTVVRDREITAHAVLAGLLERYCPLMSCDRSRFELALDGRQHDNMGRRITYEKSLLDCVGKKHLAVYRQEVQRSDKKHGTDEGLTQVAERIHRMRMVVDYVSGMTDEFALQTFRLVSGMALSRQRR